MLPRNFVLRQLHFSTNQRKYYYLELDYAKFMVVMVDTSSIHEKGQINENS